MFSESKNTSHSYSLQAMLEICVASSDPMPNEGQTIAACYVSNSTTLLFRQLTAHHGNQPSIVTVKERRPIRSSYAQVRSSSRRWTFTVYMIEVQEELNHTNTTIPKTPAAAASLSLHPPPPPFSSFSVSIDCIGGNCRDQVHSTSIVPLCRDKTHHEELSFSDFGKQVIGSESPHWARH